MDGKVKRNRRSRSSRDSVRRRDGIDNVENRNLSSGSDHGQSPERDAVMRNYGNCFIYNRPPRPICRKKGSVCQEEDIIDGFAITSFITLEYLELALRKKTKSRRSLPEGKEKWERQVSKRQRMESGLIAVNGLPDNGADIEADSKGDKEQGKRKTSSKKKKQVKGLLGGHGRAELARLLDQPSLGNSDGHNSGIESSFSGRGYSCDSESDLDDTMIPVMDTDKLFAIKITTDTVIDEKDQPKVCSPSHVSGLQRSQEQSSDPPFSVPAPSPNSESQLAGSQTPAAPLTSTKTTSPLPVCVKTERASPPAPTPLAIPGLAQVKAEPNSSPQQAHSLHNVPHDSHRGSGAESHRQTHSKSPRLGHRSSPALPLSTPYFLPGQGHRRPAMFPSSMEYPSNGIGGHPAGVSEQELLRLQLNNHFLAQSSERGVGSGPPLLAANYHQHQHINQHPFPPFSNCGPPPGILAAPPGISMGRPGAINLDKYPVKMENPYLKPPNLFPSFTPPMADMPALLSYSGPLSSLQGAFQPKAGPLGMGARPGGVPHALLSQDPRRDLLYTTSAKKAGKWCAMHGHIAWHIHHHQQRLKHMRDESYKLSLSGRLDLFSRPTELGLPPGLPHPHDLAQPLLSSGHLSLTQFNSPYPPHYLSTSQLPGPYTRPNNYGHLPSNAFGGMGGLSIAPISHFAGRQTEHGLPGFSSPLAKTWNRLHQTPPSFSMPPPFNADAECKPTKHRLEREKDAEQMSSADTNDQSTSERSSQECSHQSTHPGSSSFQISNLIGNSSPGRKRSSRDSGQQPDREGSLPGRVRIKQNFSPEPEIQGNGTSALASTQKVLCNDTPNTLNVHANIKQERRDESDVSTDASSLTLVVPSVPSGPPPPHSQVPWPSLQPGSFSTTGMLQANHLSHSLPLSMSPMHPVSSLSALENARVQPFMGVSPHAASRERAAPWEPFREPYRGLYLQSQQPHITFELDRVHRQRDTHSQHHMPFRHRQAEERAKLHQFQGSPMEGHLAHTPTFMAPLGGALYPRRSPSTPQSGHLNRTPPTATLTAPPSLVPSATGTERLTSPRNHSQ